MLWGKERLKFWNGWICELRPRLFDGLEARRNSTHATGMVAYLDPETMQIGDRTRREAEIKRRDASGVGRRPSRALWLAALPGCLEPSKVM